LRRLNSKKNGRPKASSSAASTSWFALIASSLENISSLAPSIRITTSSQCCMPRAGPAGICSTCRADLFSMSPCLVCRLSPTAGVDVGDTLIVLEEGAEATIMCETASGSQTDGGFHCGATEVILAPTSRLRLVSLQNWGHSVWHFAHQKAIVGRDAAIQWTIAAIGSRLSKVNQHVELVGRGAESQVNGVLFTEGKQHISYHTLQHHAAPECKSDFLYKAALQDQSRTVWRGMIKVDPLAAKTDGYQRNDNLLLSSNARADSIPGLEIQCDDVRCTHGSTSGKVDE